MKNLYKLLFFLIIFLLFNNNTVEAASTYNKLNENFYYEEGITKKEANKINNYIKFIPKDIYNHFINNDGSIYIVHNTSKIPLIKGICHHVNNNKYDVAENIFYMKNENSKEEIVAFFAHFTYYYLYNSNKFIILKNDYYKNNNEILTLTDANIFIKYFMDYCLNKNALDDTIYNYLNDLFDYKDITNTLSDIDIYDNYVDINKKDKIKYFQYNNYIHYDDTINEHTINSLTAIFNIIPKTIIDKIQEEKFIIILTDEDIYLNGYYNSMYDNKYYSGMIAYRGKFISIDVRHLDREVTLFHELGHFVDYCYSYNKNYLSSQFEFTQLYYNNLNTYTDKYVKIGHATSNAREFFACTFKDYILFGEELKTQYPDIFEYMEKLVADKLSL